MKKSKKSLKKKAKKEIKKLTDEFSLKVGDMVVVHQKGYASFKGMLIAKHRKGGPDATFTVRSILSGVGVEKIYPLHSPLITKIEILKEGKPKRAKLYYLRGKVGQKAEL